MIDTFTEIPIEQLGRSIWIRPGTSDVQGWKDVFEMGYHIPPTSMPTPRTVLDLGANIGLTAAHYASMWPEAVIVAVEMDLENAELARENFNGVVFQKAVTGFGGWLSYDTDVSADAYSLHEVILDVKEQPVETMSILELSALFFGNRDIDFAKLDIEGSEWSIMQAAKQGWGGGIRHMLVEFHGEPRDERIVKRGIKALEDAGYEAWHHEVHPQAAFAVRL